MTRLYGWGIKGERVEEFVPDVRFERTSIISAIGVNGFIAPMIYKGTLDANFFATYVKKSLVNELNKGDILVLDNLSSHKAYNGACLKPLIDKGVEILWLPPYSPDLNPIELSWAKLKTIIKKHKPRAVDELMRVLKTALEEITKKDIMSWFKHDGYGSISANA